MSPFDVQFSENIGSEAEFLQEWCNPKHHAIAIASPAEDWKVKTRRACFSEECKFVSQLLVFKKLVSFHDLKVVKLAATFERVDQVFAIVHKTRLVFHKHVIQSKEVFSVYDLFEFLFQSLDVVTHLNVVPRHICLQFVSVSGTCVCSLKSSNNKTVLRDGLT